MSPQTRATLVRERFLPCPLSSSCPRAHRRPPSAPPRAPAGRPATSRLPESSPDNRACNSLTPFRCPHAVHLYESVDLGLGEDLLKHREAPLHLALLSELPKIDLLLVLNSGVAPIVELTTISFDHRARQITRVWSKREYAEGPRTTPRDVLELFDNWMFSEEEFESCELVESVVATADRFCMS